MLFYLAGLTPLRQYLQRLAGLAPPPRPGGPAAPPPAGHPHPQAGGPNAAAAGNVGNADQAGGGPNHGNPQAQGGLPAAGNPPHAGGNPAAGGVAGVRPGIGLLQELQAFLVGFLTSLLPGDLFRPLRSNTGLKVSWET